MTKIYVTREIAVLKFIFIGVYFFMKSTMYAFGDESLSIGENFDAIGDPLVCTVGAEEIPVSVRSNFENNLSKSVLKVTK